jgi:hypothetical protein
VSVEKTALKNTQVSAQVSIIPAAVCGLAGYFVAQPFGSNLPGKPSRTIPAKGIGVHSFYQIP